jgi:hypothetical protein
MTRLECASDIASCVFRGGGQSGDRPLGAAKFFFAMGGRAVRQVFNALDVRPPPPFGLWLAGETGRTDSE